MGHCLKLAGDKLKKKKKESEIPLGKGTPKS